MIRMGLVMVCGLLLGCPRQAPPAISVETDPDLLSQRAAQREDPGVLRAGFRMRIEGSGSIIPGGLVGTLIRAPGGSFYSEVASGFGPKVLMVAANGESLSLVLPREGLFTQELDAEGRIRGVTGGMMGLDGFSELLLGRLPSLDSPLIYDGAGSVGHGYEATGFSGAVVRVELDAGTGVVLRTRVETEEKKLLVLLEHTAGSDGLPEKSRLELGSSGMSLELDYSDWQALDASPVSFVMEAPSGVESVGLDELIARLTQR